MSFTKRFRVAVDFFFFHSKKERPTARRAVFRVHLVPSSKLRQRHVVQRSRGQIKFPFSSLHAITKHQIQHQSPQVSSFYISNLCRPFRRRFAAVHRMVEPNRDSRSLALPASILFELEKQHRYSSNLPSHMFGEITNVDLVSELVGSSWEFWKLNLLKPRDVAHFGYCIWWLEFSLQSVGGDKTAQLSSISTKFLY